ncbi:MAG: LacI family transcriptional regulator [Leifsonia xyli]|nr:MAG: LacI family transcriptional regulator [Leifsonia xyli]
MTQLPTVEDVARLAGVSRQTVSNVINTPGIVRLETRERVEAAVRELGYRPHASARRLRTRTSSTIGIRLDPLPRGISGAIQDRFLHALTEQAAGRGFRVTLFTARDVAEEIEQYRSLRDGADVDAFVLTSTAYDDPRIDWLARERIPFVSFGRPWGAGSLDDAERLWVDVDGRAGTAIATRHLVGRGLRRIGFLGWPEGSGTGDDRRAGWRNAMREAFPDITEAELAELSTETVEAVAQARVAVEQQLAAGVRLDGLVCVSDSVALGAMMAMRESGQPHFPVMGFDNTPVAQAVGLSSVDQRLDEVATGILDLLMGATGRRVLPHGSGADALGHRLITPQLVVRRSSHLAPVEEAEGTWPGDHIRE